MSKESEFGPSDDLKDRTAKGAFLVVTGRWTIRGIGLVSVVILARVLSPADFGLMAMAVAVVALTEVLGGTGTIAAIVRHPNPIRKHYDSAWTIRLGIHLCIALVLFLAAPWGAAYFQEPTVEWMVRVLSIRPLIAGFSNIGVADFLRDLDFGKDLRLNVSARLVAFIVTLCAAVIFLDYRALVCGALASGAAYTGLSYLMSSYRPRLSLAAARELMGFSGWMVVTSIAQTVSSQVDRVVVGRIAAPAGAGIYATSQDIGRIFTVDFAGAIGRALMPSAAKVLDDPGRIRRVQVTSAGAFGIIGSSFGFGICATASDFVQVVLGSQWTEAVPFIEILALAAGAVAVGEFATPFLLATARVRALALWRTSQACVLVGALVVAAELGGPNEVALSRLAVATVFAPVAILVVYRGSLSASLAVLAAVARPLIAGAAMFLIVGALQVDDLRPAILSLTLDAAIGSLAFGILLYGIWWLIPTAPEFDSRKGLHARFCVIQGCWQQGSVFNANDSFAKRL